jgi:hypothetical protein
MSDTQLLTLVIGITFPVLGLVGSISALMYSNKRLDDLQRNLETRVSEFQKSIEKRIDNGFEHMELLLKLHEAEHHK